MGHALSVGKGVWQRLRGPSTGLRRKSPPWSTWSAFDLDEFPQFPLPTFVKSLGRKDLALIVSDAKDGVFRVNARCGYEGRDFSPVQFVKESPLIRHFVAHPVPISAAQLERLPWLKILPTREKEALDSLKGRLFAPLSTENGLVGLMVLGEKKSRWMHWRGDSLSAADFRHLAGIIENVTRYYRLKNAPGSFAPSAKGPGETMQLSDHEQTARGIAHDLNNILTPILSHAQLLEDREEGAEVRGHTAAIRQAALDGAESVLRMRGFTEHPVDPQSRTLDVNDIIRSTLQMIEPRWRQGLISHSSAVGGRTIHQPASEGMDFGGRPLVPPPGLSVTLKPAGYIWGSPAALRMVLTNIISNAVDALPSENGCVEITSGRDDQWAVISVKDNGPGIPPELRRRIFEPQFTTKGQRGSGLGLSISQGIVARHGGKLEVKSEMGRGSTFTVLLPLATPEDSRPS